MLSECNRKTHTMNHMKNTLKKMFVIAFSLLLALIFIRVITFTNIHFNHFIEGKIKLFCLALIEDFKLTLLVSIFAFPFLLIPGIFVHAIIKIFISTIVILNTLSAFYYLDALVPPDKSILKHSIEEIYYVIKAFGNFNWWYLLSPVPVLIFILSSSYFKRMNGSALALAGISLSVLWLFTPSHDIKNYTSSGTYHLTSNKLTYFIFNSFLKEQDSSELTLAENLELFQHKSSKAFTDKTYPLLHKDTTESNLAPFFELDTAQPPNFVFLIVESLSAAYSGNEATAYSLTPFLDDLSRESLYFSNFLSVGERTFSVLPSIFGSLPHGDNGFINMSARMPNHYSFLQFLAEHQYSNSAFFYGGDAHYSYYDVFMKHQNTKNIYDQKEYKGEIPGAASSVDEKTFGIDDKKLFEKALAALDTAGKVTPYVHTYLTLTMHAPFKFEGQEKYIEQIEEFAENNVIGKQDLQHADVLSTILYTDDCLKDFFAAYKTRPEYENTIFIVTGDHRIIKPLANIGPDKYHVPLLIYSPLLKRTKHIKAVNTHLDIAPAFTKLISQNFKLPIKVNPWLGDDLDTNKVFTANRSVEFMLNNTFVEQYLHKNLFYDYGKLYEITDHFKLKPVLDEDYETLLDSVSKIMRSERAVSRYVVNSNKIIPLKKTTEILHCKTHQTLHTFKSENEYTTIANHTLSQPYTGLNISFEMTLNSDKFKEDDFPMLVLDIQHEDGRESFWTGLTIKDYALNLNNENVVKFEQQITSMPKVPLNEGDEIKLFLWNNKKYETDFIYTINNLCIKAVP